MIVESKGNTDKDREPDNKVFNFRNKITKKDRQKIKEINGVDDAFIQYRYGIMLYKGAAFSWEEVEENLKPIFEKIEKEKE